MTRESAQGNEISLLEFLSLVRLSPEHFPNKIKLFEFYDDILTLSKPTFFLNSLLWALVYFLYDSIVILFSLPFANNSILNQQNIERAGSIVYVLFLLPILYFWLSFVFYKNDMTRLQATLLLFIIYQFTNFSFIFIGIFSGYFFLLLLQEYQLSFIILTIIGSITFFIYFFTNVLTVQITNYSLFIKDGLFSFFEVPLNQFDNIAAFIFGSLAPFNLSYERRYQTVGTAICVFMLLYGCFSIYSSIDRPKFLSSMGFFVQLKYGIDCIISGILSNIDIWTSISALLSYSMKSFLHQVFSIIITFICFSNYFLYTRDRIISPSSTGTTKISSNGAALSALRCGIAMNMKQVKSIEFLKWIANWRFCSRLVPDLVRILLTLGVSLNDIHVPEISIESTEASKLAFLVFQLDKHIQQPYEKLQADNKKKKNINHNLNYRNLNNIYNLNIYNNDYDFFFKKFKEKKIMTSQKKFLQFLEESVNDSNEILSQISSGIFRIDSCFGIAEIADFLSTTHHDIENALINDPNSIFFKNIYQKFCNEILHEFPKSLKNGNFRCLNISSNFMKSEQTSSNALEKSIIKLNEELPYKAFHLKDLDYYSVKNSIIFFFNNLIRRILSPLSNFYGIFYIFFIIVAVVNGSITYTFTNKHLNYFSVVSNFIIMQAELSNEIFSTIEPYVEFLSPRRTSSLLGLNDDMTTSYLSRRISSRRELIFKNFTNCFFVLKDYPSNLDQYIIDKSGFPLLPTDITETCNNLSLMQVFMFDSLESPGSTALYCRMVLIDFYGSFISDKSKEIVNNYSLPDNNFQNSLFYIQRIFAFIFIFIFLILICLEFYNIRLIMKCLQKCLDSSIQYEHCNNKMNSHDAIQGEKIFIKKSNAEINFLLFLTFFVWIIAVGFSYLLYSSLYFPFENSLNQSKIFLRQVSFLSEISRLSQNALSFSASYYIRSNVSIKYLAAFNNSCTKLITQVSELTKIGIDDAFQNIPPLNIWTFDSESYSSTLLDYAQLLMNGSVGEFQFYYARYLYLFYIHQLLTDTIPKVRDTACNSIRIISYMYFVNLVFIILLGGICTSILYYIQKQKKKFIWGVFVIIKYIISQNEQEINTIKNIFTPKSYNNSQLFQEKLSQKDQNRRVDIFNDIPFGLLVVNSNNRIIDLNINASQLQNDLNINQLIGQDIREFFDHLSLDEINEYNIQKLMAYDNDQKKLKFIILNKFNFSNLMESRLLDIEANQTPNNININEFPLNKSLVVIKARINSENLTNSQIEEILNKLDTDDQNHITRIECGVSFYTGFCELQNIHHLFTFVTELLQVGQDKIIISAVYGNCLLINYNLNIILCGFTDKRASDCLLHSRWGHFYLDSILIQTSKITSIPSEWLEISPLHS